MSTQRRALVVGFHRHGGGLARVARAILDSLDATSPWQRHLLGCTYRGAGFEDRGVWVHPSRRDVSYGATALAPLAQALRPDVVVLVNDLPFVRGYLQALSDVRPRPRVVACLGAVC